MITAVGRLIEWLLVALRLRPRLVVIRESDRLMAGKRDQFCDTTVIVCDLANGERYVFHYDADSREECLRTIGRFAANPDLAFSWANAAFVANRIREDGYVKSR